MKVRKGDTINFKIYFLSFVQLQYKVDNRGTKEIFVYEYA